MTYTERRAKRTIFFLRRKYSHFVGKEKFVKKILHHFNGRFNKALQFIHISPDN